VRGVFSGTLKKKLGLTLASAQEERGRVPHRRGLRMTAATQHQELSSSRPGEILMEQVEHLAAPPSDGAAAVLALIERVSLRHAFRAKPAQADYFQPSALAAFSAVSLPMAINRIRKEQLAQSTQHSIQRLPQEGQRTGGANLGLLEAVEFSGIGGFGSVLRGTPHGRWCEPSTGAICHDHPAWFEISVLFARAHYLHRSEFPAIVVHPKKPRVAVIQDDRADATSFSIGDRACLGTSSCVTILAL
jgi:hypothetical protein